MLRKILAVCAALTLSATVATAQDTGITEMTIGSDDAKVEIIEYASFTCPHCATFDQGPFKQIKTNYIDTGKVKFTYREIYFDRYGLWASMIARCAGPVRYFGVIDMIYAEQKDWIRAGEPADIIAALRKIGKVAGLTDDALDTCLADSDKAQALVEWFQANAEKDGINATPSFVINGKKYDNMSYADFSDVLDGLLE